MGEPMLDFYIVTLLPAAAILGTILLIRMRRAQNEMTTIQEPESVEEEFSEDESRGVRWRRSYRG